MTNSRWRHIDVTSARQPDLQRGERVLAVQLGIGLYDGDEKVPDRQNGSVYLTNLRVCYVDLDQPGVRSLALPLRCISDVEHSRRFLTSSPKVSFRVSADHEGSDGEEGPGRSTSSGKVWVCPICSFSNPPPGDFAVMPVCASCGIRAKPELFDTAPLPAPTAPPPPSQSHATGITCPRCTFENHPALAFCELCHAPLVASNLPPQLAPGVNGAAASAHRELTLSGDVVKLSFRQGGSQDMYTRLRKAIMAHEWDQVASTATSSAETSARSTPLPEVQSRVGIHGLELRSRDVVRNNETTLSVAMQDLNGLMQSAQQMVVLAESFAERLSAGIVGDGDVPQADAEARALLSQSSRVLGLTMPAVTKEASAGGRGEVVYLSELCRQIGGYLLDTGLLKREGGIMTLVDLWAVYNRARGVDLISPQDLLQACQKFEELKMPLLLRTFRSGVLAVQLSSRTEQYVIRTISMSIKQSAGGFITEAQCASALGCSISIAQEELYAAELKALVARDEALGEQVRFFENLFLNTH